MTPLCITAWSVACSAGVGVPALAAALRERRSGLRANDFTGVPLPTFIGRVAGIEACALPGRLANWECRNNRLAWLALTSDGFFDLARAARDRYGPDRVALVLGTSTSSIGATEEAYRRLLPDGQYPEDLRRPIVHTPHSLGDFVREATA
jgi:3-oxoacyl-[acyl-carrier-protein] synthase-1